MSTRSDPFEVALKKPDPYLDEGLRRWITTMAAKNAWKIAGYDTQDLIQEGLACYYKCHRRYVGKFGLRNLDGELCRYLPIENPDKDARKHLMSLVKRAFSRRIIDLAAHQSPSVECRAGDLARIQQHQSFNESVVLEALATEAQEEPAQERGTGLALALRAPFELMEVVDLILRDGVDAYRKFRNGKRETLNEVLCRQLSGVLQKEGLLTQKEADGPLEYDILGALRRYFGNTS